MSPWPKFREVTPGNTGRTARVAIVNVDPAPNSFSIISIDETALTHEEISLLSGRIKTLVLVQFLEHIRIVRQLENLARDHRPALAEHCTGILSEIVKSAVYPTAANATKASHDRGYLRRCPARQ